MTGKTSMECMHHGLHMLAWYDNLVLAPPLIITVEQVDQAIDIIDKALQIADKETDDTDTAASRSAEF